MKKILKKKSATVFNNLTCLESKFCPMYIVCWQINYSVNKNVFSSRDFSEILCLNCGWLFKSPDGKTHQIRKGKRMALKIVFLTSFPGLIGLAIFDTIELEVELKTKIKSEILGFFCQFMLMTMMVLAPRVCARHEWKKFSACEVIFKHLP